MVCVCASALCRCSSNNNRTLLVLIPQLLNPKLLKKYYKKVKAWIEGRENRIEFGVCVRVCVCPRLCIVLIEATFEEEDKKKSKKRTPRPSQFRNRGCNQTETTQKFMYPVNEIEPELDFKSRTLVAAETRL